MILGVFLLLTVCRVDETPTPPIPPPPRDRHSIGNIHSAAVTNSGRFFRFGLESALDVC